MTTKPLVVCALQEGTETLGSLIGKYNIAVKVCEVPDLPYKLVGLKYDMIQSIHSEPIVQECRGIILRSDTYEVVARGFDKFFNYGEGLAANIDWSTARVQEKVDGSCCLLYHVWKNGVLTPMVATLGSPDASGSFGFGGTETFSEAFFRVLQKYKGLETLNNTQEERENWTHIFELTSPQTQIVIPHTEDSLTYLDSRCKLDGKYKHLVTNIPKVKEFPLGSFEEIISSFDRFKGSDQEGYVVVDGNCKRVKVKHPVYVALHHSLSGPMTPRRALEIVLSGEIDEIVAVFKNHKDVLMNMRDKFHKLCSDTDELFKLHNTPNRKEYAMKVKNLPQAGALFTLHSGKTKSAEESFRRHTIDALLEILEKV